jgi:hypothetical protein
VTPRKTREARDSGMGPTTASLTILHKSIGRSKPKNVGHIKGDTSAQVKLGVQFASLTEASMVHLHSVTNHLALAFTLQVPR